MAHQLAQAVQLLPFDARFMYASFDADTAETSMTFHHENYDEVEEGKPFPVERFAVQSTGTIFLTENS